MNRVSSLIQFLIVVLLLTLESSGGKKRSLFGHRNAPRIKTISLFPNARAWCKGQDIDQVIEEEGCTAKKIKNKFCFGQCFSYIAPDVMPSKPESRLAYCDSCQPSKTDWMKVQLNCSKTGKGVVEKLVQMVLECKCKDCRKNI